MCEANAIFTGARTLARGGRIGVNSLSRANAADAAALSNARAARAVRRQVAAAEEAARREAREGLGALAARQSGSGVRAGTGSPVDRAGDLAAALELDILTDRARGEARARRFEARAGQNRARARRARRSGALSAASSLLGLGDLINETAGSSGGSGVDTERAEGGRITIPSSL